MNHDQKTTSIMKLVGVLAAISVPALTGLAGSVSGMPVEDVVKMVVGVGILPALLIFMMLGLKQYSERKDAENRLAMEHIMTESRSREDRLVIENRERERRMAERLDKVEDRYHTETVSLASRCIETTEKCTEAFNELNTTLHDHHKQTMYVLTQMVPGGSVSMVRAAHETPQKQ